jgi:hypothetical protein
MENNQKKILENFIIEFFTSNRKQRKYSETNQITSPEH